MFSFQSVVQKQFESVNQHIIQQLHSDVGLVENIGHYIVESGGKRLRPLIVLLHAQCLAESTGATNNKASGEAQSAIVLATIIEFIHTATLLHDDVVDTSSLRRGRPTANAQWGNAPSVLVGDFLYSRAFQLMVGLNNMAIMKILSDTTNTISEGEVQQLINVNNPDTPEADYLNVIHKKTAALFEAACECAAVINTEDKSIHDATRRFGYHLGLAFQLIDDALDYSGSTEDLGKNVGDDLAEGKPTLPLIYAMKNSSASETTIIQNAIKAGSADKLEQIVGIVKSSGALDYTKNLAKHHAGLAQAQLEPLPDNVYRQALHDLASFSVERSF